MLHMKYENEPYEIWVARVEQHEKELALQRIAQGEDIEIVMTEMSKRMVQKLLHPILKKFNKIQN